MVVLTRWLLIGLLISVGALLFVAGAVTRHILRQRQMRLRRWLDDFNEVTTETWTDQATGLPLLKTTIRNPVTWERSERIEVVAGCGTGMPLLLT